MPLKRLRPSVVLSIIIFGFLAVRSFNHIAGIAHIVMPSRVCEAILRPAGRLSVPCCRYCEFAAVGPTTTRRYRSMAARFRFRLALSRTPLREIRRSPRPPSPLGRAGKYLLPIFFYPQRIRGVDVRSGFFFNMNMITWQPQTLII